MSPGGRTMSVNVGCKGIMNLYLTVKGKAYHSATPHKGENAVYRAAEVIEAFRKMFDPATMPSRTYRVWRREVMLGTLATITEVEARQGVNVIPGACELVANCRLLPDGDSDEIERRMKRLASQFPKDWLSWRTGRKILGHLCGDEELIAACRSAVRETGMQPKSEIMSGRTDTTIFQNVGVSSPWSWAPALSAPPTREMSTWSWRAWWSARRRCWKLWNG